MDGQIISFEEAKQGYAEFLKLDYARWTKDSSLQENLAYRYDIQFEYGKHYQRVVSVSGSSRSSHSFIVLHDYTTPKGLVLKQGDILKSASWKAPALNFVRGNIFTKDFQRISWTGVS